MRKRKNIILKISIIILFLCLVTGYAAFGENINLKAKGNIKEKSRIIKQYTANSNEDFHTDFYKENITTITFLDKIDVPKDAITSWDISSDSKGGVIAYIKENSESKYDLFIASNGKVIANSLSNNLFSRFKEVKEINFNGNFDTSKVTNMIYMFSYCTNLKNLDLSTFDTSNVYEMGGMFEGCYSLESVDLSSFNTKEVRTMWYMFTECHNLKTLNLNNFYTPNLYTVSAMFEGCSVLETLNLCNFDTSKITAYERMFNGTSKIKEINVNSNWNLKSDDIFTGSSLQDVTAGKCIKE